MTKKTRNITVAVLLFIAVLIALSSIIKIYSNRVSPAGNAAGNITSSEKTVKINNTEIPSYMFKNGVYINVYDLLQFGFEIETADKEIHITFTKNPVQAEMSVPLPDGTVIMYPKYKVFLDNDEIQGYIAEKTYLLISADKLRKFSDDYSIQNNSIIQYTISLNTEQQNTDSSITGARITYAAPSDEPFETASAKEDKYVIVLDPGHGKDSGLMTDEEKQSSGWIYSEEYGGWGEWRHWKSGSIWQDCGGYGCNGRITSNGSCWYPISDGDRADEPDINLQNSLSAKQYLEEMGYEVRMTRTTNEENPSITKRLEKCYPNGDTTQEPDADVYICIHSNSGGGCGSAYISLGGKYDQKGISSTYVNDGNSLGKLINDKIVSSTSLSDNGVISNIPELILFCKSPVPVGYLEIGFFDNNSDYSILRSETGEIGKAIAEGTNEYFNK